MMSFEIGVARALQESIFVIEIHRKLANGIFDLAVKNDRHHYATPIPNITNQTNASNSSNDFPFLS